MAFTFNLLVQRSNLFKRVCHHVHETSCSRFHLAELQLKQVIITRLIVLPRLVVRNRLTLVIFAVLVLDDGSIVAAETFEVLGGLLLWGAL